VRSASPGLFLHFLLQRVHWQLEATAICVPMAWGLLVSFEDAGSSYCVRTETLAPVRHLNRVRFVYVVFV